MTRKTGRIGMSFEDYLAGQGTLEETRAVAVKRVLAWQLDTSLPGRTPRITSGSRRVSRRSTD